MSTTDDPGRLAAEQRARVLIDRQFEAASRGEVELEPSATSSGESPGEKVMATPELVTELCDLLGAKLVAYATSVPHTRTVRAWADPADPRSPPNDVIDRLRIAHQAASLLGQKDSAPVIQACSKAVTRTSTTSRQLG